MSMEFSQALRYLLDLGHETLAIKLGLRNIELLLAALDHPEKSYPAVQIAGTNGKGSTAVVLDSICGAAGITTGLYTSPHLVSITERIRVGGVEISKEEFASVASVVRDTAERLVATQQIEAVPTFFEQVTAIAFAEFKNKNIQLAILETGLGGRLDATTAAGADIVAITPIALDHQQYLGDTLASIAAEKAAIIRPGVTAIIGNQSPEALEVILRACSSNDVNPSLGDCQFNVDETSSDGRMLVTFATKQDRYPRVRVALRGLHQLDNIAVAIRLAESLRERGFRIAAKAIVAGIETAKHPGRLELWPGRPALLFDGAHNVAGARALRAYLDAFVTQPITMIFSAMADKNVEQMASILFPTAKRIVLAQQANPRAATTETLQKLAAVEGVVEVHTAKSVTEAINIAKEITPADDLICITGSLYLVGDAQAALKANDGSSALPLLTDN
ncbi:MAG: folylpolyglutamate synthase/dihydrofolate synthase family protein [Pyrinomonadaceae bacterium]